MQTTDDAQTDEGDAIVITGSRITRPNLDSTNPITTVEIDEIVTGDVSLGNALSNLPQLGQTYTSGNSTRFIGTSGLSILDLRNLGTARTLVLVNGRRHVTAQPGSNSVDVNTIPTDLVEGIDILTGGNSAIYGPDAVAGVVNFRLRRDFDGIAVRGQAGMSDRGDAGNYFVSVTAGENFADNRGNIAVNLEYARSDVLYFTERDDLTGAYSGRSQLQLVENTGPNLNPNAGALRPTPEAATGNGVPDNAFITGVRNTNISLGGLLTAACPVAAATGESNAAFQARRGRVCSGLANPGSSNPLSQFGNTYVFRPDGSLVRNNCITDFRPVGSANCVGGEGSTLRETGMLQPQIDRYAANLLASFEVSQGFRPFIEAKFVRVESLQEGQPTFFNNTFSINNPFLTDQARGQLQGILAPGVTTFTAQRFNTDFAGRGEDHRKDTFRIVGGIDGTFNNDWRYEVAANYGRTEGYYETRGNVLIAEYGRSINAVRNTQGQIVCAVNNDASTANDDPACVPVNLFGEGQPGQAALDYFGYTSAREELAEQFVASAFVSGNLGQLFTLPGGPIGFAVGAEYRRETASSSYDETTKAGLTFLNAIADFAPPALEVKEVFGEVRVPLLANMPFAHELSIEGAGRLTGYNVGNKRQTFTWNIGGIYAPIRDVRLRASYAKSVRAPTQSNLFSAETQTFANGLADPCGLQNINNNPNRVRNCAAAGVPTTQTFNGVTEPFSNRAASGVSGFNRGNPLLDPEESLSLTIGAVFQPTFLPGFTLSIDYYNIEIEQAIQGLTGQTIINQCYDNESGIDNPFCAVVFRNPNGTFAGQQDVLHDGGTVTIPRTGPAFFNQPFNFAKFQTNGIDVDMNYRMEVGAGSLSLRSVVSHVFRRNNFTDVSAPDFRDRTLSELGEPRWEGQVSANLEMPSFDLFYQMRYIDKQVIGAYETFFAFDGRAPLNPDSNSLVYYPETFYHNVRLGLKAAENFRFYLGVDNIFDTLPPLGLLGTEGNVPYGNLGRSLYAGASIKF
ncbi:TonB-dependent receptor [Sphingomonas sp. S1-29]|uniref:TonB-dependent receptor domain-containing protein n=1 Tax=Sphingomonas sp. S1-29 TaxID=2991074 RepID=UPI00223F7C58|nr:TonB-dependent receptor [Sphingomonas sp. S1-29]UZK70397.1 TonB-dependent receptor [Sphingomonas sp. S1-29]